MLRHETPCQRGPEGESGRICLPWELCRLQLGAREAEGSVSLTWRLPARPGVWREPQRRCLVPATWLGVHGTRHLFPRVTENSNGVVWRRDVRCLSRD